MGDEKERVTESRAEQSTERERKMKMRTDKKAKEWKTKMEKKEKIETDLIKLIGLDLLCVRRWYAFFLLSIILRLFDVIHKSFNLTPHEPFIAIAFMHTIFTWLIL